MRLDFRRACALKSPFAEVWRIRGRKMRLKLSVAAIAVLAFAGSAFAADLPSINGPSIYPPPAFTWTGLYVGGQLGYEWGTSSRTSYNAAGANLGSDPTIDSSGIIGGAHVGYNYQIGPLVAGLEVEADGDSYTGSGLNNAGTITASGGNSIEGSVRGRVGVAWDRALLYATGGLALASESVTVTNLASGATDSFANGLVGWTVGGGIEYAIDNNWSVSAEYRYTDFGDVSRLLTNTTATVRGGPDTTISHETDNRVQIGFSYKFDPFAPPVPVVAKY